ncbi:hypothetical protein TNCV_904531 [Trichonephila clavipes]|nr:hypothetical protein TNCV_904531 [Trichonephila clavipes]
MAKYHNICDNNSITLTNLPISSSSTPLLPNSLVGVSDTVVFDDGSSSLEEDIPITSNSTALLPNTPIDVKKLDRFFKALIGGEDIRRRDEVNCHKLSNSLVSDAIYCVSNVTVKPSKHITLGLQFVSAKIHYQIGDGGSIADPYPCDVKKLKTEETS